MTKITNSTANPASLTSPQALSTHNPSTQGSSKMSPVSFLGGGLQAKGSKVAAHTMPSNIGYQFLMKQQKEANEAIRFANAMERKA